MHRFLAAIAPLVLALGCYRPAEITVKSAATAPSIERMAEISGLDHRGQAFSLEAALSNGPVVVVFYRGHW